MSHIPPHILLHLSLIEGIGPATVAGIVQAKPADMLLSDIYTMSAHDIRSLFDISHALAATLVQGLENKKPLDTELMLLEKHSIAWATMQCPNYPSQLLSIHVPPTVIYWQGEHPNNHNSLAVVGSRKANQYGQTVIDTLIPSLVHHGFTIVSGGALGADSLAHHATLKAGGKTVAVVGSGLLQTYPASNKKLFAEIVANGGTMLSTFPLTIEALPGNFPARNRIISGLSRGCVVIQAAARSGTSITAHYALEQGREVFAVPGPIDDPLSAGCHALIAQGAKLVTCANDILQEFGYPVENADDDKSEHEQNSTIFNEQQPLVVRSVQEKVDDSPIGIILHACAKPCSTDELVEITGLTMPVLTALLFDLQLEGKIAQNFMGLWQRR